MNPFKGFDMIDYTEGKNHGWKMLYDAILSPF